MAENTAVNNQITDAVTQVNTKVSGENTTEATSEALNIVADNTQQQSRAGAPTTSGVSTLYNIDTSSGPGYISNTPHED